MHMAQKQTKTSHTVRLDEREQKTVTDDIASMVAGGATPVSVGAYCKHAVLSYARLRKMEVLLRDAAKLPEPFGVTSRNILEEIEVRR